TSSGVSSHCAPILCNVLADSIYILYKLSQLVRSLHPFQADSAMFDLELSTSLLFYTLLPLLFFFIFNLKSILTGLFPSKSSKLPRSYPIVGSFFAIYANRDRPIQWTSDVLLSSPTATFVLHRPLGRRQVFTANPSNLTGRLIPIFCAAAKYGTVLDLQVGVYVIQFDFFSY
ncbi:unnamed protein product, partial [Thlaspi arvense]